MLPSAAPPAASDTTSVADGYLYVVTRWARPSGVDLSGLGHLDAFMARVAARPAVQQAQQASDPR